jgi:hypothetical protein
MNTQTVLIGIYPKSGEQHQVKSASSVQGVMTLISVLIGIEKKLV